MSVLLTINNLSCQRGYTQLFSELNFTLNTGDILRITGENGKGKTSLLRIIAGLSTIDTGVIAFKQQKNNDNSYQDNILYLGHQNALVLELSALDNLLFLVHLKQKCSIKQAKYALDKMGLQHYYNEPCAKLSAGQKRRVLLASLFILKYPLWLLDEPFTALDTQGVALIEQLVLDFVASGGACIFTTHQKTCLNQYRTLTL